MNVRSVAQLFTIAILVIAIPNLARGIPTQALNSHLDDAADISYIQDSSKKPDETNHFHVPLRTGETITVSNDTDTYGLRSNQGWAAFEDWDNNNLRFQDTPDLGDGKNALLNNFAQGYIDPLKPPLYKFEDNVPADAQKVLKQCFDDWTDAAKAQIAGKKSPAGNPLSLGIKFKEAAASDKEQFDYKFSSSLQGQRKEYGEWVVSQDRVSGAVNSTNLMIFESNPSNFVTAPAGVTLKIKTDLIGQGFYSVNVGWNYTKTPKAIPVDLQYVKDGQTFESLPGEMLTTNTGLKIPCADIVNFYQMDFYTIALHETGHILGLLHAPDDPTDSIMRANIEKQASWNVNLQKIDASSAFGVAELYTIAVPEPGLLALAVIAGVVTWCARGRDVLPQVRWMAA